MTLSIPTHPGGTLKHCLADSELTARQLAAELRVSRSTLYRLMRGDLRMTAPVAVALERLGWSNAEFWLRLQNLFDLAQVRKATRVA